ncbi:hypothetical protein DSO57_1029152 [Entomophthora muscae]|uniref:Uncharacterized protein n=1 Tax=Entomophthora muscae TaxID=34485 RepID=A0ACC2ULC7_9FUNG|nr:hypothetical protein DSO57_1029152 [Entomophthora muscae]
MSTYFNGPFRTSLRMAQCLLSLLHLYLALEYLTPAKSCLSAVFACLHAGLALVSFLFSGAMTDHNRKTDQSTIEYITITLAIIWLLASMATSFFVPALHGSIPEPSIIPLVYHSPLPMLWNEAHQLNAITWSASAFLSIIDLLNLTI